VNRATLEAVAPAQPDSLQALLALDAQARRAADQAIAHLSA